MSRNREKKTDLLFGPGGSAGWTPAGISGFRELKPTAAIRELIQNSLDAAIAAGRPAEVRFAVEQCPIVAVPGIDSYRTAFKSARDAYEQSGLSVNARTIVDEIDSCLNSEQCAVLYVMDNGVGLDEDGMNKLLMDGKSEKKADSAGSYGVGHSVVFPASDLRYVLYGGLSNGKKIAAGHAILAAHPTPGGKKPLSENGYLCKDIRDDFFNGYDFPVDGEIPDLIDDKLHLIADEWGNGSVVAVAGFNDFREEYGANNSLKEQVFRAAACNFFDAIHAGDLTVGVAGGDGVLATLDSGSLPKTLEKYKDEKRKRRNDLFLSGGKAYEAFQTLKEGAEVRISDAEVGDIRIKFRLSVAGKTSLGVCRNGMWITDDIPMLHTSKFAQLEPFNGLFQLEKNSKFSQLVRELEPPLHNDLNLSDKNSEKKSLWKRVMDVVAAKLHEVIPQQGNESFNPDDILVVDVGGLAQGGNRAAKSGSPTVVSRRRGDKPERPDDSPSPELPDGAAAGAAGNKPKNKSKSFTRSGNLLDFSAGMKLNGKRKCRVFVIPGAPAAGSEIRFALDESIDVTSDGVSAESFAAMKSGTIRLNGKPVQERQLRKDQNGNILGILLGGLEKGKEYQVDMEYSTAHLDVPDEQPVVLKVELLRRSPPSDNQGV